MCLLHTAMLIERLTRDINYSFNSLDHSFGVEKSEHALVLLRLPGSGISQTGATLNNLVEAITDMIRWP